MVSLSCGAIFGGAILSWLIFPFPYIICISLGFKLLVLIISLIGGFIGYLLNLGAVTYDFNSLKRYKGSVFCGSIWFIPFLSTNGRGKGFLKLGINYHGVGDIGWSEYYGGQGIYLLIEKESKSLQILQDNSLRVYILSFLFWLVILFFIMI